MPSRNASDNSGCLDLLRIFNFRCLNHLLLKPDDGRSHSFIIKYFKRPLAKNSPGSYSEHIDWLVITCAVDGYYHFFDLREKIGTACKLLLTVFQRYSSYSSTSFISCQECRYQIHILGGLVRQAAI